MSVMPAGLLLLLTWLLWAGAVIGWGLFARRWLWASGRSAPSPWRYASAGWIGLGVVTVFVLASQILVPLGTPTARIAAWTLVAIGWLLLLRTLIRDRDQWQSRTYRLGGSEWALVLIIGVGVTLAAIWAAGSPSNYDTGLYHAQSIWYSRDFATIPGLANLHDRLGFNSSMWPTSSLLGLGLWTGEEFRLFNGLLIVLAAMDVTTRMLAHRMRSSAGTLLLVAGLVLTLAVVAQYPGRLIASSAQDTAALVLAVAAVAALLDAVCRVPQWRAAMVVAIVLGLQAALMRPLGWAFLAAVVLVTGLASLRRIGARRMLRLLLPTWVVSAIALVVMLIRDTILSGWLLFPLSAAPMPVAWRMPNPEATSRDITGWARTPFQDVDQTLSSNDWIGPWLRRLPTDWSIPVLLVALAALVVLVSSPGARVILGRSWRPILMAEMPVAITLGVWLVNAPDPRFAWGYLICVGIIPLAVMVAGLGLAHLWKLLWSAAYIALLVVAIVRGSLSALTWSLGPMPSVSVRSEQLADGTSIRVPNAGDQCWSDYPLCAPDYGNRQIVQRGDGLGSGFESVGDFS